MSNKSSILGMTFKNSYVLVVHFICDFIFDNKSNMHMTGMRFISVICFKIQFIAFFIDRNLKKLKDNEN